MEKRLKQNPETAELKMQKAKNSNLHQRLKGVRPWATGKDIKKNNFFSRIRS